MRGLTPALAAVFLAASVPLLSGQASAQTCTCARGGAGVTILSDQAPPSLPDYDQPPIPGPGYMWTPGYWAWNNYDYYWVPGTWVEPPQPGLLWTPGYWGFADGVYGFHRGYWGPKIGFYGGVNYGYGYGGHGYDGGYWNGDRFFYNRSVNHFGTAHIENTYEKAGARGAARRAVELQWSRRRHGPADAGRGRARARATHSADEGPSRSCAHRKHDR